MNWTPRPLSPRFHESRTRLQNRYASVSRLPDASRLAHLRGSEVVVSEEQIRDLWVEAMAAPVFEGEASNNIYIHVPFCKSICNFCNYERLRPSNPRLLEAWLQRVILSIQTMGPAVNVVEWGSVYIGGGTPSTLPAPMLRRLFEAVDAHLNVASDAHRSFEFDPIVMSGGRADVLSEFGFTHFSFGIQTLDPDVNRAHNRGPQGRDTISKRFEELYSRGLYDVACDFLLGLAGTTPESILEDIEWVLTEHKPLVADVFQIAPTPEYVDLHFKGDIEAFWSHLAPFEERAVPGLAELGKKLGYKVNIEGGHSYTLTRDHLPLGFERPPRSRYSYNQLVTDAGRPMHLLGFGPGARSQIFGYAACRGRAPTDAESDEPFRYAGHKIDLADEIRTYLVHQLRDNNHVDRAKFERIFGKDVTEAIPVAVSAWDEAGLVKVTEDKLILDDDNRRGRMATLLWLVPERHLEHEIARRQSLNLNADGVEYLASELEVGRVLSGGHQYGGVDDNGRVQIVTPDRLLLKFRVAPGLEEGKPIRLVLESTVLPETKEAQAALTKAMVQVRAVLRAAVQPR
jgi:coproporphyrinogen III oxidase-like Fe-S oxidoreductase